VEALSLLHSRQFFHFVKPQLSNYLNFYRELRDNPESFSPELSPNSISEHAIFSDREIHLASNIWSDFHTTDDNLVWELDWELELLLEEDLAQESQDEGFSMFKSEDAIERWAMLWDDDIDTRWKLVLPIYHNVTVGKPEDLTLLLSILRLNYLTHFNPLMEVISSIQANCKFYNYEIHQKAQTRHPPEKQQPPPGSTIIYGDYIKGDKIEKDKISGDKYEIDQVGNLNTGTVNIQGNQTNQ
jgi:hypothetical protein